MRILRLADPDAQARSRTPLGDSLVQLKTGSTTRSKQPEVHSGEIEIQNWQDRWHENQDQIARQLALIEAELDRLLGPGPESLQLGVFQDDTSAVE